MRRLALLAPTLLLGLCASPALGATITVNTTTDTLAPGLKPRTTYLFRLVAAGPDGTSTGDVRSFTTPAVVSRDRTAPRFASLKVSPKRFRAGAKAKITFRLSETATVTLDAQQPTRAVKVKPKKGRTRCVSASAKNRRTLLAQIKKTLGKRASGKAGKKRIIAAQKRARCTLYVSRRKFKKTGKAGANTVSFTGKIGKRTLKPGTYRLTLTATDASHNHSRAARTTFTILKPKKNK